MSWRSLVCLTLVLLQPSGVNGAEGGYGLTYASFKINYGNEMLHLLPLLFGINSRDRFAVDLLLQHKMLKLFYSPDSLFPRPPLSTWVV